MGRAKGLMLNFHYEQIVCSWHFSALLAIRRAKGLMLSLHYEPDINCKEVLLCKRTNL